MKMLIEDALRIELGIIINVLYNLVVQNLNIKYRAFKYLNIFCLTKLMI